MTTKNYRSDDFVYSLTRRDALKVIGAGAAAWWLGQLPVMAGPFTREDFDKLVPADKKLDPLWVKSLFARGAPTVYRGEELNYIGMPIGGICAGQIYLGGDGKLWHWDIFNQPIGTGAGHYRGPLLPKSPFDHGFALTVGGKTFAFDKTGFSDITFQGGYPVGTVEYRDPSAPVAVKLEAFSPFIPLNTDDSSLPATILQFTLTNSSTATVEAALIGTLENAVLLNNRTELGTRRNRIIAGKGFTFLECAAEKSSGPTQSLEGLEKLPDFGTMGLALMGTLAEISSGNAAQPVSEKLTGELGRKLTLATGQSATVTFILTWHFPNPTMRGRPGKGKSLPPDAGRFYATKFDSALAVAQYAAENFERLAGQTRLWRDTWYDSTLPYWFLDRTQANTSTLATSTCFRYTSGRFWAQEGVGCCGGTCTHVWHYAQAMARQFPELERILRERTDFGTALQRNGVVGFRGNNMAAIDGQAGVILRSLREHQMSADSAFLRRIWPGVKRATDWLIAKDGDGDGIIEDNQHNTLDSDWFGPIAWLSGLYLAALAAAATLAEEMDDPAYAEKCRAILACGQKKLVAELFDGDYFINKVDPNHLNAINSGTGCEIDQVMGQSWAFQVGLPRVLPERETKTALKSLWKYNFTPDVGPYRKHYKPGRCYATAGEAGLLMCTFPRSDWDFDQAAGRGNPSFAGYFNECMNGFEYQVAGHMVWENMVLEGLTITRTVHDRYHASKRNPWNEVECGDHYARSMASYGVFLATCGFEYHGPKGYIGFAPRITPEDFKAAFTSAEGWGTYRQTLAGGKLKAEIEVKHGKLRVKTIALALAQKPAGVAVTLAGQKVPARFAWVDGRLTITLDADAVVADSQTLAVNT